MARPVSAAQAEARLSSLAAGNRAAVPGDRAGVAPPNRIATGIRARSPRPGQTDRAVGAAEARSLEHRAAPALQSRAEAPEGKIRSRGPTGFRSDRRGRARSCGGVRCAERGAARDIGTNPGDVAVREVPMP